jgi:hypothetical protein
MERRPIIGRRVVGELNEHANPPNGERWAVMEVIGPAEDRSLPLRIVAYYHDHEEAVAAKEEHNARGGW